MSKEKAVLILAAGKGTRMKSSLPKVLHKVCGESMLGIIIDTVKKAGFKNIGVVAGYKREVIEEALPQSVEILHQNSLKGTAHALLQAEKFWRKFENILVLYGDHPLIKYSTLRRIWSVHTKERADLTLLTTYLDDPKDYGRVIRDDSSKVCAIIEKKDLTPPQLKLKETNPGVMCFKTRALKRFLNRIRLNKRKKEYYLTDIVFLLYRAGSRIKDIGSSFPEEEGLGVNSLEDLVSANELMRKNIVREWISKGVYIPLPQFVYIELGVSIGKGTRILPFTVIERGVKIGRNCLVGPFSHLREGTILKHKVEVGNFAELKNTQVRDSAKIRHFSYLGDAWLGREVNIGAGTVTANFDGTKKHRTVIKDKAFIGSDTIIVAPVVIGRQARTGAGSVILRNRDIKKGETVVGVPAKPLKKHE